MAPLLVVTGPPGSGKSTVARLLADRFEPSALIDGDSFFAFLARGAIPPWLPESNAQNEMVTEAAACAAGRYAQGGYTTVYDGIVGPWFLPTFARAASLASLDYVVLMPTADQCVERVQSRLNHGFTDLAATRKMYDEFASADVDERHVLADPPENVSDVADLIVAAFENRALIYERPV